LGHLKKNRGQKREALELRIAKFHKERIDRGNKESKRIAEDNAFKVRAQAGGRE
jgi:hypothetical protein